MFKQWIRRWAILSKTSGRILGASYGDNLYVFVEGTAVEYSAFVTVSLYAFKKRQVEEKYINQSIAEINMLNTLIFDNTQDVNLENLSKKIRAWNTNSTHAPKLEQLFVEIEHQFEKNIMHVPLQQQNL